MNIVLLAEALSGTRLLLEYLIYAAVIVVGILILLLLRRKTRLPRHSELKKELSDLRAAVAAFRKTELPRIKFYKGVTRLLYRTDKLIYVTDRMADKERDGEIDSVSGLLGQARSELAAYKQGARHAEDAEGIRLAAEKLDQAAAILDRVLARDVQLKGKKA